MIPTPIQQLEPRIASGIGSAHDHRATFVIADSPLPLRHKENLGHGHDVRDKLMHRHYCKQVHMSMMTFRQKGHKLTRGREEKINTKKKPKNQKNHQVQRDQPTDEEAQIK